MPKIATITLDDLDTVATIHCVAFSGSLLSGLGHRLVRRYYRWLLTGPHDAIALGVRRDGELVGFGLGGVFRGASIGFLRRNCIPLAWSLALRPKLLFRSNHRQRLVSGVRTVIPFLRCEAKNGGLPLSAQRTLGIMAIAVNPQYGRSGYGCQMMEAFDQIASDRNFSRMQLRVNPANEVAVAFYHKLGWGRLPDEPWTGVMFKLIGPELDE